MLYENFTFKSETFSAFILKCDIDYKLILSGAINYSTSICPKQLTSIPISMKIYDNDLLIAFTNGVIMQLSLLNKSIKTTEISKSLQAMEVYNDKIIFVTAN